MVIEALVTLLVGGALLWLLYGPWQWICTDVARQILFEKRDQLFDLARAGELSFNSPEYRQVRKSLETLIRFAHQLSLPRFVVSCAAVPAAFRGKSALRLAVASIENASTRQKVDELVTVAQITMIIMMVVKSPVALFVGMPIALIVSLFKGGLATLRPLLLKTGEIAQLEAEGAKQPAWVKTKAYAGGT